MIQELDKVDLLFTKQDEPDCFFPAVSDHLVACQIGI